MEVGLAGSVLLPQLHDSAATMDRQIRTLLFRIGAFGLGGAILQ
jgi:hypothetical protein